LCKKETLDLTVFPISLASYEIAYNIKDETKILKMITFDGDQQGPLATRIIHKLTN